MKVGDEVYFEFELGKISDMKNGKVKRVTSGCVECGGFDLSNRCFVVNEETRELSAFFYDLYYQIKESQGMLNINNPDIHSHLVSLWAAACSADGEDISESICNTARDFTEEILSAIEKEKSTRVLGIRLFRH